MIDALHGCIHSKKQTHCELTGKLLGQMLVRLSKWLTTGRAGKG